MDDELCGTTFTFSLKAYPHYQAVSDRQALLPYPILVYKLLVWVVGTEVTSEAGKGKANEQVPVWGFTWNIHNRQTLPGEGRAWQALVMSEKFVGIWLHFLLPHQRPWFLHFWPCQLPIVMWLHCLPVRHCLIAWTGYKTNLLPPLITSGWRTKVSVTNNFENPSQIHLLF